MDLKIRKARHRDNKERWLFWRYGLASLYEGLVITLSLAYLNSEARLSILLEEEDKDGD